MSTRIFNFEARFLILIYVYEKSYIPGFFITVQLPHYHLDTIRIGSLLFWNLQICGQSLLNCCSVAFFRFHRLGYLLIDPKLILIKTINVFIHNPRNVRILWKVILNCLYDKCFCIVVSMCGFIFKGVDFAVREDSYSPVVSVFTTALAPGRSSPFHNCWRHLITRNFLKYDACL